MIGDAPLSPITGCPGWETVGEQYALLNLAKQVPDGGCIVEIGAEYGMSASIFIYGTNLTHYIYSIDLFPDTLLDIHKYNLRAAGLAGRSNQLQGDSVAIAKQAVWLKGCIDLLFIDADHSYEGCKRDIEAWIPEVKSRGVVAFHDAAPATNFAPHPLHLEVQRAVDEWAAVARWQEFPSVDTMRIFVKP